LLLGVSLAHLSWRGDPPPPKLPPKAIVLTLPAAAVKGLATTGGTGAAGTKVHLFRMLPGQTPCRLSREPLLLLARHPQPLVTTPLGAVQDLASMARTGRLDAVQLRDAGLSGAAPPCVARPRVSYGGS
jgi:hypothetical protein